MRHPKVCRLQRLAQQLAAPTAADAAPTARDRGTIISSPARGARAAADITVQHDASAAEIVAKLDAFGCCIVERLAPPEAIATIKEQISIQHHEVNAGQATTTGLTGSEVSSRRQDRHSASPPPLSL